MRDMDKIAAVVKKALSATFGNVKIVRVDVLADPDDDDFLSIKVVFEGTPVNLDARKVSGAVRQVRPKLTEMGEEAFPLLSFISMGDDAGQRALA
jgi:hypothetical protein